MAVQTTYPGVYIEELPSGQHTIAPVATSITAFVGRAPTGPTDEPTTIFNYGDYQRSYGGLRKDYPMSYAVQDYFNNGGSEAIIVRLFQPNSVEDPGVGKLAFPISPPVIPDGWMLKAAAAPGDGSLSIAEPTSGSEGEPAMGFLLKLGDDRINQYTVLEYIPATSKQPASISINPQLAQGPDYGICTPLDFSYGPFPSGWSVLSGGKGKVVLSGGTGLPQLGDRFTAGSDAAVYTVSAVPTAKPDAFNNIEVTCPFSTTTTNNTPQPGEAIVFAPPQPSPLPVGWQIEQYTPGKTSGTLNIINGTGEPKPHDQFAVGTKSTVYVVKTFTPAAKKTPAQISFAPLNSADSLPPTAPAPDFCYCCELVFNRLAPQDYMVKKPPKIGDTAMTVDGTSATGVIDVGDTFMLQGDTTVYTVRIYDPTSGQISFLPKAATAGSNVNFSPPLSLEAASPGEWGNLLDAKVDTQGITARTASAKSIAAYGLEEVDLFNLTLAQRNDSGKVVKTERYLNVTTRQTGKAAGYPNRLDHVLARQSTLARVGVLAMVPPASGSTANGIGGDDGSYLQPLTYIGDPDKKTGLYMLNHVPLFNLLCIPPDRRIEPTVPLPEQDLDPAVRQAAAEFCTDRRAMFIVDPPAIWADKTKQGQTSTISPTDLQISGENAAGIEVERNCAVYFPRVYKEDLLMNGKISLFPACGIVAGVMAATDVSRGVWKAPAGMDAGLAGVSKLEVNLTDDQNGLLNPLGINCLRSFPVIGPVVWGARTLRGADQFEDAYKYIPVRRLTLLIEDSLYRGTQWAVFEPNDEALWSALRLTVETFLAGLAKEGAFYDYNVTCDATTTTPEDIELGVVNILVQIAPVKPAEFVVVQIQQKAGGSPG